MDAKRSENHTMHRSVALVAIDIEARGQNMIRHGILSIGYCLGLASGYEVLECGRISLLPLPGQSYEDRCLQEFWSKNEMIKKKLEAEAVSSASGIAEFHSLLVKWDKAYDLHVISDHPAFDIGFVNYYLALFGHRSMSFKAGTEASEYRGIYDTDGYIRGRAKLDYDTPWTLSGKLETEMGICVRNKATHFPDDDARVIYESHVKIVGASFLTH